MTQREIRLDDDDNQAFAFDIANAMVYDCDGTPHEIWKRCFYSVLDMLDHPHLDPELRDEIVKSAGVRLGIKIIV